MQCTQYMVSLPHRPSPCEHAIWLPQVLGHQVVNQRAQIAALPLELKQGLAVCQPGSINACDEALREDKEGGGTEGKEDDVEDKEGVN